MNGRKVVDFLLFRSVMNSRNLTSLMLVGFFFLIYVVSGGKITTVPKGIKPSSNFGGVKLEGRGKFELKGDIQSSNQGAPQGATKGASRGDAERAVRKDRAAAVGADNPETVDRSQRKDRLSDIEARLNSLRKNSAEGADSNAKERN